MRTIKTYSKRAPFYNALTRHVAGDLLVVDFYAPLLRAGVLQVDSNRV
jgi:hypothetical protein